MHSSAAFAHARSQTSSTLEDGSPHWMPALPYLILNLTAVSTERNKFLLFVSYPGSSFSLLKQVLTLWPRLAFILESPCLHLENAKITGVSPMANSSLRRFKTEAWANRDHRGSDSVLKHTGTEMLCQRRSARTDPFLCLTSVLGILSEAIQL